MLRKDGYRKMLCVGEESRLNTEGQDPGYWEKSG